MNRLKTAWAYWLINCSVSVLVKLICILVGLKISLFGIFLILLPITVFCLKVYPNPSFWNQFRVQSRFH